MDIGIVHRAESGFFLFATLLPADGGEKKQSEKGRIGAVKTHKDATLSGCAFSRMISFDVSID